jgi:penicillin amidase
MRRLARRLALWVVAIVLLAFAGIGSLLLGTLPRQDGTVRLPGLEGPVAIARDGAGVVTIRASGDADAAFALGFAHAEDRLFQMDLTRRLGAGRLSEIMGEPGLRADRFMRRLGLYRVAQANYDHLPAEAQQLFQAYAAGVNAFLLRRDNLLPPEFLLLRYRPEPWKPADSLVWGRLMAWQLSGNWRDERLRRDLAGRLSPQLMQLLWPTTQRVSWLEDPAWMPLPGASNNWVLAGNRSVTGKPILANDPHLGLELPAPWYLARIETPGRRLTGATAPGVPMIIIGDNGHVAWGFTTTQADTQDLFVETLIDGEDYKTPDGAAPLVRRAETIHVRGAPDVVETVLETRHGPLIDTDPLTHRGYALAWTGLRPADRTALGLLGMNRAANATAFREALRDFESPVQNVVYADTGGAIGFMAAGRIPIRRQLADGSQMPVPGDRADYEWTGVIPFDALPQGSNPPDGYFATANNRVVDDSYPYFITARWDANYRIDRIRQMLAQRPKHDLDEMAAMQLDSHSSAAEELVPLLLAKQPEPALVGWDRRAVRGAAAPLIFTAWLRELAHGLLDDKLGADFYDFWSWDAPLIADALRGGRAAALCDDGRTEIVEDCALQVRRAHERAMKALAAVYGPDMAAWHWGNAHRARFPHALFGRIPGLRQWFDLGLPAEGDNFTVNRASPRIDDPAGAAFDDMHGAGLRAIFDLADLDRSRFVIAGGQSGNPFSAHYADFARLWQSGRYVTIVGDQQKLLTLEPEAAP